MTVISTPGAPVPSGQDNFIKGNSIYSNGKLGIDLGNDGVTPNDPGDTDTGPNTLLNFPEIVSAVVTPTGLDVSFTLDTRQGNYTIEFFSNATADPTGYGEGQQVIYEAPVNISTIGDNLHTVSIPGAILLGTLITATTSWNGGGTSEFSRAVAAGPPQPPVVSSTFFNGEPRRTALAFQFDQQVAIDSPLQAASVINADTGAVVKIVTAEYQPADRYLTIGLFVPLPNDNYVLKINSAAITNNYGQHLAGDGKTEGTDYTYTFFILTGDTNGNRTVDFTDFMTLAQHYAKQGDASDGDFDSNMFVDFRDLLLLAQNYGRHLSPPARPARARHVTRH